VTMKNAVFWDVSTCGFYRGRRFGGKHRLHIQDESKQQTESRRMVSSVMLRRVAQILHTRSTLAIATDCNTLRSIN
jgi:hypothetical protein